MYGRYNGSIRFGMPLQELKATSALSNNLLIDRISRTTPRLTITNSHNNEKGHEYGPVISGDYSISGGDIVNLGAKRSSSQKTALRNYVRSLGNAHQAGIQSWTGNQPWPPGSYVTELYEKPPVTTPLAYQPDQSAESNQNAAKSGGPEQQKENKKPQTQILSDEAGPEGDNINQELNNKKGVEKMSKEEQEWNEKEEQKRKDERLAYEREEKRRAEEAKKEEAKKAKKEEKEQKEKELIEATSEKIDAIYKYQNTEEGTKAMDGKFEQDQYFSFKHDDGRDIYVVYANGDNKPTQQDAYSISITYDDITEDMLRGAIDNAHKELIKQNMTGGTTVSCAAIRAEEGEINITTANVGDSPILLVLTDKDGKKKVVELSQAEPDLEQLWQDGSIEVLGRQEGKINRFIHEGSEYQKMNGRTTNITSCQAKGKDKTNTIRVDPQGVDAANLLGDPLNKGYFGASTKKAALEINDEGEVIYEGETYKSADLLAGSDGLMHKYDKSWLQKYLEETKGEIDLFKLTEALRKDSSSGKTTNQLYDNIAASLVPLVKDGKSLLKPGQTIVASVADGNGTNFGQRKAVNALEQIESKLKLDRKVGVAYDKDNNLIRNGNVLLEQTITNQEFSKAFADEKSRIKKLPKRENEVYIKANNDGSKNRFMKGDAYAKDRKSHGLMMEKAANILALNEQIKGQLEDLDRKASEMPKTFLFFKTKAAKELRKFSEEFTKLIDEVSGHATYGLDTNKNKHYEKLEESVVSVINLTNNFLNIFDGDQISKEEKTKNKTQALKGLQTTMKAINDTLNVKSKEQYDEEVLGLYKASSALWDATKVAINPKGHINFTARIALSAAKLAGSALTYTLETAVESAKSADKNAWKVIEDMTGIKQWQIEAWAEESVKLIEDMKPKLKEAFVEMEKLGKDKRTKLEALEKELKAINRESSKELETKQQEIFALQKQILEHGERMESLKTEIGEYDKVLTTHEEMKANGPNFVLKTYNTAMKLAIGFVVAPVAVPVAVIAAVVEAIDRTVIKGPRAAINRVRVVAGEVKKSAVDNYSEKFQEKRFARARKYVRGKHAKAEKERKTAEEGKIER